MEIDSLNDSFALGVWALPVMLAVICLVGFLVIKKSGSWAQAIAILFVMSLVPVLAAGWLMMATPYEVPPYESKSDYAVSHNAEFDYDSDNHSHVDGLSPSMAASSHVTSRGDKSMIPFVALLILAVLVIGGIVLLVALLSNEKTRPIGYVLLGVGFIGVLLVGVAGVSWVAVDTSVSHGPMDLDYESEGENSVVAGWESSRSHSIQVESTNPEIASDESIDLSKNLPKPPEPKTDDPSLSGDESEPPKSETTTDATSLPTTAASDVKPAWVDRIDSVASDGTYETKVSVGPYQTQLECLSRLDAALVKATNEYIQEFLYQGRRTEHPVRLSVDYIKRVIATGENYTERTSVRSLDGREMVTLHVRLRFAAAIRQDLKDRQKSAILSTKFWYTGIVAGLVLTALLSVFGYLKLDTVTKGFYTRRLQFSAGVVILAVMAMGYLLLHGKVAEPLMHGMLPF